MKDINDDGFVLPEKWHLLVDEENLKDASYWIRNKEFNYDDDCYLLDHIIGSTNGWSKEWNPKQFIKTGTYDFGIQITYSQFLKYVLKIKSSQSTKKENNKYLVAILKKLNIK